MYDSSISKSNIIFSLGCLLNFHKYKCIAKYNAFNWSSYYILPRATIQAVDDMKKKKKKRCQKSALQKSLAIYPKATTRRPFPRSQPRKRNNKHPKTLLRRTIISIDDRAFSLCHTSSGSSY